MRLPRRAYLVSTLTALLGLMLQTVDPLPLANLRNAVFDQYQRWQPRHYRPQTVRIVDIDEASLARLGQWPWPRTRIAELTVRLRAAGAKVIGFDFIFAEPDRTSPLQAMQEWRLTPEVENSLRTLPDHDRVLADALRGGGVVLGAALERSSGSSTAPRQTAHFVTEGNATARLQSYRYAVRPLPILEAAADGIGALNFVPDGDGVVRRVPLVLSLNSLLIPAFSTEMLRLAERTPNILLGATDGGSGMDTITVGNYSIPVTERGELWLKFTPRVAARTLPAWKVLANDFPRGALEGMLVLVGSSAQGLLDLRFSPLGEIVPGIEIHAQTLEQLLSGEHLARPHWALGLEALLLAIGTLGIGVVALRTSAMRSAVLTLVLLCALGAGAWQAFRVYGILLDPLTPGLAIVTSFVLMSIIHHRESEQRQRWVREAFSRYVSPNLVDHLIAHPERLELGGERRECSFVFSDIADFTRLMERTDAGATVALLNHYMDGMIAIAFRHEGTLERVVGDAIAIMFSAPLPQTDHRQRALDCALEMRDFANAHRAELATHGVDFGITRIGVHCGEVIVGNLGGSAIFDYRALGDPVNTASRLETANKQLGTQVCISQAIVDGCANAPVRPIGRLQLVGKDVPVAACEALPNRVGAGPTSDAAYVEAYALLNVSAPAPAALAAFAELHAARPDDALVQLHLTRLQRGESGDLIVLAGK